MTPVAAILFDIGGVLEITPSTGWQKRWEMRLGLAPGEVDERLLDVYRAGTLGRVTLADAEQQIARRLALEEGQLRELMADLWAEYLGTLNLPLYDWFRALRPRYKTGIVSNSWVGAREKEDAAHGFGAACDTIVYSHEEGVEKPDPGIYLTACERLGVRPDEVVFLDDLRANVRAAVALGMRGVLFVGETKQTIDELTALLDQPRG